MLALEQSSLVLLLLIGVLGSIGLYLVLPHRFGQLKPTRVHAAGAALTFLALVLLAGFWIGPGNGLTHYFFYAFGLLALGAAVLMISSRDPVNSALWFAVVILSSSGLFLLAGAQFLAAGTVIVYAGAIIVTFLFVIMLAQSAGRAPYDRVSRAPLLASISSMLLLVAVTSASLVARAGPNPAAFDPPIDRRLVPAYEIARRSKAPVGADLSIVIDRGVSSTSRLPLPAGPDEAPPSHVASLGGTLFVDHLITVEIVGVILFVALIGACSFASQRLSARDRSRVSAGPATGTTVSS